MGLSFLSRAAAIAGLGAIAAGCGGGATPERVRLARGDIGLAGFTQLLEPPEIAATRPGAVAAAAARLSPEGVAALRARRGARRVQAPQLGLFYETPLAAAYVGAGAGRALAQGWPTEQCPALGLAFDRATAQAAAETALNACFAALPTSAPEACGCRLLAADDLLLAPQDAFAYAGGVHAELAFGGERPLSLVAETAFTPEAAVEGAEPTDRGTAQTAAIAFAAGGRAALLRTPVGVVGAVRLAADGVAEARIAGPEGAEIWRGRRSLEGFRRGHLAEKIALEGPGGQRATLLIGYEPAELVTRGASLRAAAAELFSPRSAARVVD